MFELFLILIALACIFRRGRKPPVVVVPLPYAINVTITPRLASPPPRGTPLTVIDGGRNVER